jgi:hypothetical protein
LLVHAAKSNADIRDNEVLAFAERAAGRVFSASDLIEAREQLGHVVGVVDLVGIDRGVDDSFALPNQYNWLLSNPRKISPFPAKGKLGLWYL